MSAVLAANDVGADATFTTLLAKLRPDNPRLEEALSELLAVLTDGEGSDHVEPLCTAVGQLLDPLPRTAALADCLLRLARIRFLSGRDLSGLDYADAAAEIAHALGDSSRLWQARNVGGVLASAAFDLAGAHRRLNEALTIARERGDTTGQAKTLVNIGVVHFRANNAEATLEAYEAAMRLTPAVQPNAFSNLCYLYLVCCDYERARQFAERSVATRRGPPQDTNEVVSCVTSESNYIGALAALGNGAAAQERVAGVKALALRLPSLTVRSIALTAEGTANIAVGAIEIGSRQLGEALQLARQGPAANLYERLEGAVRAYELAGQPDAARACLNEMFSLKRQRAFNLVRSASGPSSLDMAATATAARLECQIASRLESLLQAANSAKVAAGHDHYSVFRIARLARDFATSEGWSPEAADSLALAARLCDVGMMTAPDYLLMKRYALSEGGRKLIMEHTSCGGDMLVQARLAVLQPCALVARFHHERWDGKGTWGLSGDGIPLEARIVALCDVFDALTHDRPWRRAKSLSTALREIESLAGTQFDPELTRRFAAFVRNLYWAQDDFEGYLTEEASADALVQAREQSARLVREGR